MQRILLLKKDWADGLSFSQIAAPARRLYQECSCISKANRLLVARRRKPGQQPTFARERRIAPLRFHTTPEATRN
jgi:hypothetical protein